MKLFFVIMALCTLLLSGCNLNKDFDRKGEQVYFVNKQVHYSGSLVFNCWFTQTIWTNDFGIPTRDSISFILNENQGVMPDSMRLLISLNNTGSDGSNLAQDTIFSFGNAPLRSGILNGNHYLIEPISSENLSLMLLYYSGGITCGNIFSGTYYGYSTDTSAILVESAYLSGSVDADGNADIAVGGNGFIDKITGKISPAGNFFGSVSNNGELISELRETNTIICNDTLNLRLKLETSGPSGLDSISLKLIPLN